MARLGVGLSGRGGDGSQWPGWGWVSVAGLGVGLTGREWVGLSGSDGWVSVVGMGWVSVVKMRVGLSGRDEVGLSGQDEGGSQW